MLSAFFRLRSDASIQIRVDVQPRLALSCSLGLSNRDLQVVVRVGMTRKIGGAGRPTDRLISFSIFGDNLDSELSRYDDVLNLGSPLGYRGQLGVPVVSLHRELDAVPVSPEHLYCLRRDPLHYLCGV